MYEFFDPTDAAEVQIPMYGQVHLYTVLGMIVLLLLIIWQRKNIKSIINRRKLMTGFMTFYILIEILYWVLIWAYRVEPWYERFPLHLCASMSILTVTTILMRRQDLMKFFSYWMLAAGFISFANPGFVFVKTDSFGFIHYLVRHYFVLLAPVVMNYAFGFRHNYKDFIKSLLTLAGWAVFIFFLNWATGANWLHLGQHNPLAIPFLPASFTDWPWVLPSFAGVGVILLHLAFVSLKAMETKKS